MPTRLSPAQREALELLHRAERDPDGYSGVMMTDPPQSVQDGTAWIYFRTALALERRGRVELDYRFGRVKLS
jgi:hypothetical protein